MKLDNLLILKYNHKFITNRNQLKINILSLYNKALKELPLMASTIKLISNKTKEFLFTLRNHFIMKEASVLLSLEAIQLNQRTKNMEEN